jgi:hypothetical protein
VAATVGAAIDGVAIDANTQAPMTRALTDDDADLKTFIVYLRSAGEP